MVRRSARAVWVWLVSYGWLIAIVIAIGSAVAVVHVVQEYRRTVSFVCDAVNEVNDDDVELLTRIRPSLGAGGQQFVDDFIANDLEPIECPR